MFKITPRNRYGYKDQKKADIANAYIGYGKIDSSTEAYYYEAMFQDIPCNDEIEPNSETVAFVSMNGGDNVLYISRLKTLEDVLRVLKKGGTIVADNPSHRSRQYNYGERWLAEQLTEHGYKEIPHEYYSLWVNNETDQIQKFSLS